MMPIVEIDLVGVDLDHLEADVAKIMAGIEDAFAKIDYTEYFDDLLVYLIDAHETYFDLEQDPSGTSWPPLSPTTIQRKGHDRILIETHRLKQSLVSQTEDTIIERIAEPPNWGLSYGTAVEYAIFHQSDEPRTKIPQRKMVGLNTAKVDEIAERAADAMLDGMYDQARGMKQINP